MKNWKMLEVGRVLFNVLGWRFWLLWCGAFFLGWTCRTISVLLMIGGF